MKFIAIDLETANEDRASICQIGMAKFENGSLIDEFVSLVDPLAGFRWINTKVHGFSEKDVVGSPTFPELADRIVEFCGDDLCVSHTSFDSFSLQKAFRVNNLGIFDNSWVDTARVARITWEEFSRKGYGLENVCKKIGYSFKHHDALEDAKACAHVLIAAIQQTGIPPEAWLERIGQPISQGVSRSERPEVNENGLFSGENIVFTGTLLAMRRADAQKLAAQAGCQNGSNVTRKTTLLVVGEVFEKTGKYKKAEKMMEEGAEIRILSELDFHAMIEEASQFG